MNREKKVRTFQALTGKGALALARGRISDAKRIYRDSHRVRQCIPGLVDGVDSKVPFPVISVKQFNHVIDQLDYLIRIGKMNRDLSRSLSSAKRFTQSLTRLGQSVFMLDPATRRLLSPILGRRRAYFPDEISGRALEQIDRRRIEEDFRRNGYAVIDRFLTVNALAKLRRFCLESPIWFDPAPWGLRSRISEGFGCGLLFQIDRELEESLPGIFSGHPFSRMWAHHYDSKVGGKSAHADLGAVTANFWPIQDSANLSPSSGGLHLYEKRAQKSWDWAYDYSDHKTADRIARLLKNQDFARIPYRCNRIVLFESARFHRIGKIQFDGKFENRRISITLIHGNLPL